MSKKLTDFDYYVLIVNKNYNNINIKCKSLTDAVSKFKSERKKDHRVVSIGSREKIEWDDI